MERQILIKIVHILYISYTQALNAHYLLQAKLHSEHLYCHH